MEATESRVGVAIENHCPFGCDVAELDEHGYCEHLVGFTNDGKTIETIQLNAQRGLKFVSGKKEHLAEVQRGDKLVNPTVVQLDNGIKKLANRWVSSRVYRKATRSDS